MVRPLQAHTGDPNGHSLVSPARGTTPYSHIYTITYISKITCTLHFILSAVIMYIFYVVILLLFFGDVNL